MRTAATLLLLAVASPLLADAVENVRQTEIAFAKAFAARDKAKFFSFVADDATFLTAGVTLRGKAQIVERWSRYFEGPRAPFSWTPDRVSISADGRIALSSGPVFLPDGDPAGSFVSTWRKQSDGTWKVVFDSSGPGPAVMPEHVAPREEGFVTMPDGVKLRYRKVGTSPMTMIVPLDYFFFDTMKQFADIATVITYDPRARGRSDRGAKETWTVERVVADLEAVRNHFKVARFVPVGFSYLGKVVMLYAAAHPDRVRGVIQLGPAANADSGPFVPVTEFGAPKELMERVGRMRADRAEQKAPREFCMAFWQMLSYYMVGDPRNASKSSVEAMCALENEWGVNLMPFLDSVLATMNKVTLDPADLKKITARVLTIHGTADRNARYEGGRAWASSVPDGRLVTIPGAAHMMWLDAPEVTFAAIRAFLREEWPLGSQRVEGLVTKGH